MAIPAILDGRYFDIIAADGNKVRARCLMCTTKPRIIEGFKTPTSNFKTHLKRLHPEKLLEYEAYKFNKRRKVDFTSCIPSYSYSSDFNLNIKHEPTSGTGTGTPVTFTDYMPKLLPTSGTGTGTPVTFTDYMPKLLQKDKRVGKLQYQDDTLLMDFIIESMSPVEIVEGENFKRLIKGFHSDSTVMSAKTLKTSLLNKAAEQTKMISEQLAAASTICMTVDICSIGNISYLGSTVHILDEFTFARKSFTLACRRFGGPLTYDEVSDVYQELVDRFEIDTNKIHYIITNNGNNPFKPFEKYKSIPNMNGDTEMILPESPESELEDDDRDNDFWLTDSDILFGSSESSGESLPQHFKSASHNLNLVATIDSDNIPPGEHCQGYTELLQSSMGKCAAIYNKSHRSPDYGEMIKHIFISGNMKEWTCQYDVLVQLLKGNLEEVCLLFQLPEFTDEEVEFLKEYLKAVGPIATALEMLHIDNKFMFGCLAPTILSVQTKLKDFLVKDQLRLVTPLVHALLNGLSQRFPYVLELDSQNEKLRKLIIASISMPYFKLRWIPQEKLEEFKQVFVDEAVKMVGLTNSVPVPVTPKLEEQEFFEFPSQSPSADSVENSANAKIKLECRQYFESGGIELEILHYFPNIKKLFLIHNTPISSSSPVEKMLNFSGLIKSPGRGDMVENDLFEILRFLKCNGN